MSERPYITCQELIDFLHMYLDGELPPDRAAEFDRHLSVCVSCVNYIQTYKIALGLGRAAFEDPASPVGPEVPAELVSAILAVGRRQP